LNQLKLEAFEHFHWDPGLYFIILTVDIKIFISTFKSYAHFSI